MSNKSSQVLARIVSGVLAATAAQAAVAQAEKDDLENIVVTGTRVADRSALETSVPVDIVSAEALSNVGVTELNQALSIALPSFNFPRPGLADGTDTIRPATLRGLVAGPDAGAAQLEASSRLLAGERERHDRPRRRPRST